MKKPCPVCNQMVSEQGMRMHKDSAACLAAAADPKPVIKKEQNNPKCDAVGQTVHKFRLLNSNDPDEAAAMEEGNTKVCVNCMELG